MPFSHAIYYSNVLVGETRFRYRMQKVYDKLKSSGLDSELGVNIDFGFPGHGQKVYRAIFGKDVMTCGRISSVSCQEEPYFSLALTDQAGGAVACLIAHWESAVEFENAKIVVDLVKSPVHFVVLLFEVMEKMIEYFWLTWESDNAFDELKRQEAVEMVV